MQSKIFRRLIKFNFNFNLFFSWKNFKWYYRVAVKKESRRSAICKLFLHGQRNPRLYTVQTYYEDDHYWKVFCHICLIIYFQYLVNIDDALHSSTMKHCKHLPLEICSSFNSFTYIYTSFIKRMFLLEICKNATELFIAAIKLLTYFE